MLKAILKRQWRDSASGATGEQFITIDFENAEIEQQLIAGGLSETGFEVTQLVGVEVVRQPKPFTPT